MKKTIPFLTTLIIIWMFFVLGSFFTVQKPFSAVNAIAVGNVLLDLLTIFFLAVLSLLIGNWFLQRFMPVNFSPNETLLFSTALGLGALGLLILDFGAVDFFKSVTIYMTTLVLTIVLSPQIKRLSDNITRPGLLNPVVTRRTFTWDNLVEAVIALVKFFKRGENRPDLLPAIYILSITILALLAALLPPTDWDGLFYHLTIPKLHMQTSGLIDNFNVPHFNFPALMEMLFTWAVLVRGDIAAKLIHALFGLLLVSLVYITANRFFGKKSSWLSVIVLISMPMVTVLAGWAYNDLALAFFQLASLYILIKWVNELTDESVSTSEQVSKRGRKFVRQTAKTADQNRHWLILSGIFAGFAMGLKYTSFVTPLVIGGLILWYSFRIKHKIQIMAALMNVATFFLTTLLISFPWYIKSLVFTGNPVYPFLFNLFGGQQWDSFRAEWYAAIGTGIGFQPTTLISLPWLLTLGINDMNYWDGRTGPLLLLFLPLIILYVPLRRFLPHAKDTKTDKIPPAINILLVYALIYFLFWTLGVIWSRSLWQSRLLLPALVALTPVAGWVWSNLHRLDFPKFSLSRFINIAIVLTLTLNIVDTGLMTLKINPLPYLTGSETRAEYLTRRLGAYYVTMEEINTQLPSEAKVVFLWEPRSYYCQLDCRPDSILDEFPHLVNQYGSAKDIAQAWRDEGVTHILIHRAGLNFELREKPDKIDVEILSTLESKYLQKIFDSAGAYQLYELNK